MYSPLLARFISPDSMVQVSANQPKANIQLQVGYFTSPQTHALSEHNRLRHGIGDIPEDPQLFNRYTYARSNPLIYSDPTGHLIWKVLLVDGVVGGVANVIGYGAGLALTGSEFKAGDAAIAFGAGFAAGALAPIAGKTILGAVAIGAASSGAQYAATQAVNQQPVEPEVLALNVAVGGIGGRISGAWTAKAPPLARQIDWANARPETASVASRSLRQEVVVQGTGIFFRSTLASSLTSSAPAFIGPPTPRQSRSPSPLPVSQRRME